MKSEVLVDPDKLEKVAPELWCWSKGYKEIRDNLTVKQVNFMIEKGWSLGAAYIGMISVYPSDGRGYVAQIGGVGAGDIMDGAMGVMSVMGNGMDSYEEREKRWTEFQSVLAQNFFKWLDEQMELRFNE
jgi:hypothetical protein